LTFIYYWFSV